MIERYYGHDAGLVVTQPKSGVFEERPMTIAELVARAPAAKIQDDIYRHANQAGVCYYEIWKLIAAAAQEAIDRSSSQPTAPLFECRARRSLGANDPQDCDYPNCGCELTKDTRQSK